MTDPAKNPATEVLQESFEQSGNEKRAKSKKVGKKASKKSKNSKKTKSNGKKKIILNLKGDVVNL